MVEEKANVRHIIREFVASLEPDIIVDKAILFGSHAIDQASEWSDIDVAVISKDFGTMATVAKIRFLAYRSAHADSRLEALGYSLSEFQHADRVSFLGEIKHTGKIVYERRKRRHKAGGRSRAN
jgi:uncharacterized protein